MAFKQKKLKKWSNTDVLEWIQSIGLSDKWQNDMINAVEECGCTGRDWFACKSGQDIQLSFDIEQPMLANRMYREFKKMKVKEVKRAAAAAALASVAPVPYPYNDPNKPFELNIFAHSKYWKIHQKVTANTSIRRVKELFKAESGTGTPIENTILYSKGRQIPEHGTLGGVGITNDKHLITIKFKMGGLNLTMTKQQNDDMERKYNEQKVSNTKLNAYIEKLSQKHSNLDEQHAEEITFKNALIQSLNEQNESLKQNNNVLQQRLAVLEQQNELNDSKSTDIKTLKTQNESLQRNVTELQQHITTLKRQNIDKQRAVDRLNKNIEENAEDISLKTATIKSLSEETKSLKGDLGLVQQRNNELNASNIKLNEECKELQTDLNEMRNKYNKLYNVKNLDESKYMEWNSDDITDWIIHLDSQYEVYEDALRVNLKKEDMDGSVLSDLDKNDLHRFGIISIKHKVAIAKRIKMLISQQLPQNNEGKATVYI